MRYLFAIFLFIYSINPVFSQITTVGSGSYTNTFPGVDSDNRNGYPNFSPQLSGAALNKPIPTNDWWSFLLKENHVSNLFNYPFTMSTTSTGLGVTYVAKGVVGDKQTLSIGVQNLNAGKATVEDLFYIVAEGDVFVEVYDILGNKLKANNEKAQDISAFSAGIYFVKVIQLETAHQQLIKIVKKY